jgi:hypothetical protein
MQQTKLPSPANKTKYHITAVEPSSPKKPKTTLTTHLHHHGTTTAIPNIHEKATPGAEMVTESQKATQVDATPGMAEGGKPPTKERRITTAGAKKILTLGTKCHREMTTNNDNRKSTMMKRRTRRSTQKGGVITTTQGLRDNHTAFLLGDSNDQSHLMQRCYNPRHLQQHPLCPLQQAHEHIQA